MKFGVAVTTSVTPAVTELDQKDYVERVSSVAESNGFDSIWVSDEQPYYVMYYYRPTLKDYNSIELNTKSRRVTGYEWDEQ